MRAFIATILAAMVAAGCESAAERGWGGRDIPVTKPLPKETPSPVGEKVRVTDLTSQPASEPSASEEPAAAPVVKPRPMTEKPQVIAQTVVQVNDNFLTVDDVLVGARTALGQIPAGVREETFRNRAATIIQNEIRDQVNELLVGEEAAGKLTDGMKQEVDREIVEAERVMIAKAGGSRVHLEQMVLKEGTTLEKLLQEHRRRVESRIFVQGKMLPAVMVNRRLLWEYYQAHKADEFTRPKMVQMQTVIVRTREFLDKEARQDPTKEELEQARKLARQAIAEIAASLRAGKDFDTVAAKAPKEWNASCRTWEPMAAGSFAVAKVEQAAFSLPQGGMSEIIEEEGNFYLVRVAKILPGENISFEDAQPKIDHVLRTRQMQNLSNEYYQKLIRKAVIVESPDFAKSCVDRAVERYWKQKPEKAKE